MKKILFIFSLVVCSYFDSCTEDYPVKIDYENNYNWYWGSLLSLNPNPVTNRITVLSFSAQNYGTYQFSLTSVSGKEIKFLGKKLCSQGSNSFTIDLSDLPDGIYIIHLIIPDGMHICDFLYKGKYE